MTTAYRSTAENHTARNAEAREWGTTDRLGRTIGNTVTTYELDMVPVTEAHRHVCWRDMAPGHYFAMYTQATRNGQRHQASSREQFFTTAAERDAAVAKHFAGAEKRARDPKAATKA